MKYIKKGIKTTIIGIIAMIGLCYKIYTEGGLSVEDFIILITAVGFLLTKDANQSHTKDNPPEDDEEDTPG